MKYYFTLLFLSFCVLGTSQKKYPQEYFAPPMKIPIVLAGTFGELRSNHFHSGIDIKTQQREGIPIYAPASGYIYRIKVAQYGFGKVLYMKHPSGHTTVYAHLQKFSPEIQEYVKKTQYSKQSYYTGNLFPTEDKFVFEKGDLIAYSGDTGSSGGPHLHYEIRDSKTEKIINPMHFGLTAKDTKSPSIQKLMIFPLDKDSRINNSNNKSIIPIKNLGKGNYVAEHFTASGNIGFGVSVFDRLDDAPNKNGIYSLQMNVNGEKVYYHDLETFSFAESKYINLLIDYEHYAKYKNRFQKTHKVAKNKLSLYEDLVNDGKIIVNPHENYKVDIIAKDYEGNTSTLRIPIKGVESSPIMYEKDTTEYKITTGKFHKFTKENVSVAIPKNSFYYDTFLDFEVENGVAKIHEPIIPLDKKYTLTFNTSNLNATQRQQVYIANVSKPKYPRYVSTKKKQNKVYTNQKSLGSYTLKYDSIKPTVSLVNFSNGKWISQNKTLKVKIKDKESGIKSFRGTIDNEWILMEYNHKKGILIYDFTDKKLVGSKHIFKIVVSDNVGNTKTLSTTFYRKE